MFVQGQNFWNVFRKTVKGEGESQPKCEIQNGKVKCQDQGRAKGQIHLIGYIFTSSCHRDFKLGSYFSLWKATPNKTLTLTFGLDLEMFVQGQSFWNMSIKNNSKVKVNQNVNIKGQSKGRAKGQIHLIGYDFASNSHRDFKLGSYFNLWKAAPNMTMTLTFDLDLEKFTQGQNFWSI